MSQVFEDFVPRSADAEALSRSIGLGAPHSSERWVLLGVAGRAVLRKMWSDDLEVTVPAYDSLLMAALPEPDLDSTSVQSHRALVGAAREAKPGRCSSCWLDRGFQLCGACGGSGNVQIADAQVTCRACDGARKLTCTTCEGSAKTVRVQMAFVEDHATSFAHAFVPEVPLGLVAPLVDFLKARPSVPPCLSIEIGEEHARADAYRGQRSAEQYRGHRLGNAIVRARVYVERIQRAPSVVASRHAASAWPFALLSFESARAALVVDERGAPALLLPSG